MKTTRIRENIFNLNSKTKKGQDLENFPGYPKYPAEEDIYKQSLKEPLDSENPESNVVDENQRESVINHKIFKENHTGDELDVPGSELDDAQEDIGSEDEENNYYSLGGDNHNDLEESTDRE
jgi:hypothetical protein